MDTVYLAYCCLVLAGIGAVVIGWRQRGPPKEE